MGSGTIYDKLRQQNSKLAELTELWMKWDKNESTRQEVESLLRDEQFNKLELCMTGRLSFGTAGIRAAISAGFNRLNDLTLIQTAQGVLRYLQSIFPEELLKSRGFVIGYDARHSSERFAYLFANILAQHSVKVYLFSKIVPTPFVSYAIKKLQGLAGAMVTASHNPKCDNGLKVYWSNGAQILSPHDSAICNTILNNLEPWSSSWDVPGDLFSSSYAPQFLVDPYQMIFDSYLNDASALCSFRTSNSHCELKFTYTPVHGVGYYFTPDLIKKFGFKPENIVFVEEQLMPDPDFPTAPFPNPEEGLSVLAPSVKVADENGSSVILANDPDADRFQLAEKQADGSWRIFTGNEIGSLLAWWLFFIWRKQHPTESASQVYMINSVVSSRTVKSIADAEGFNYEETLTGFKWMANRAHELQSEQGKTVLLCWEESIGYMPGGLSYDKDGVVTAALFAEYAAYLKTSMNKNFVDHLDFLNHKYGYHINSNSYFICKDPNVTKRIFDRLRNFDQSGSLNYPKSCGKHAIKFVRDLTIGYDNSQADLKPILPISQSSQMITFTLDNDAILTLRASGTEPKIKYYIEIIISGQGNITYAEDQLEDLKNHLIDHFLQPKANKLVAKA